MNGIPASSPHDAGRQERLRQRVAHCLDLLEEGGPPAVAAYLAEEPEDEELIRTRLGRLADVGLIGTPDGRVPERLGDFRLLELLGQGGMGIVHRAWQESLQREVALKIVRPDQLWFEGTRTRFQREVEAIARLQHPGIAAIHAVGEEGSIPYFAMERLRGATLAQLLEGLRNEDLARLQGERVRRLLEQLAGGAPLGEPCRALLAGPWPRVACRIAWHVADTLQFTHEHGILHRDVKPNNVFLTVDGRVVLLDFGLASLEGADHLTRTGAPVGSLPYMAPEVLELGREGISPKIDVYGLGVTLYELLTGRSPFLADTTQVTLQRILAGDFVEARRWNASLPWDVQVICATAMERDPERRYENARALTEDLRNALASRPIRARRAGPWHLARRFARRHPARATALALLATAAVVLPVVFGLRQRTEARVLGAALERTMRERDRASRHAHVALRAVQEMLVRLGDDELENVPGMDALRAAFVRRGEELCRELLDVEGDEPELLVALGTARTAIGSLLHQVGDHEEARTVLEDTIAYLDARVGATASPRVVLALAGAHLERGNLGYARQDVATAERHWSRARELLEALDRDREAQDGLAIANNLASCLTNLAALAATRRATEDARRGYEAAIALREELVACDGANALARRHLGVAWIGLAMFRAAHGPAEGVDEAFERGLARLDELLHASPDDAAAQRERAHALHARARWLARGPRADEADVLLAEAQRVLTALVAAYPGRVTYRQERCDVLGTRIGRAFAAGAHAAGLALAREEVAEREALAERDPDNPRWVEPLGFALGRLAVHANAAGDAALAEACWTKEEVHWTRLLARDPDLVRAHYALSLHYANRQTPAYRAGDWPLLTHLLERTIHHRRRLLTLAPHVAGTREKLAHDCVVLAVRRLLDGHPDDALHWLRCGVDEADLPRERLTSNTDLAPLRPHPDFLRLVERAR